VVHWKPYASSRCDHGGGCIRGNILNQNLAPMKIPMLCNEGQRQRRKRSTSGCTSKDTSFSAIARARVICQKRLQACLQPVLAGWLNEYASKSGPPLGNMMIAYTCDTDNMSGQVQARFELLRRGESHLVEHFPSPWFGRIRPTGPAITKDIFREQHTSSGG
jgi:hypothetical protein